MVSGGAVLEERGQPAPSPQEDGRPGGGTSLLSLSVSKPEHLCRRTEPLQAKNAVLVHTGPFLNWVQPVAQVRRVCIQVWESACMYTEIHMYCCLIPLQTDLRFRSTKKPQARTNAESLASAESTGLGEVKLQQNMYVTCMQPKS